MKKLFLASSGLPPETTGEFLRLLNKNPKDTKVCFISTASNLEKDKRYVTRDKKRLLELGFKIKEVDLKQENESSLNKNLGEFDVVYVEGGSTFYLLKYIRESGFDKIIKKYLEMGGIYFGVSAGSYVVCPNIEAATWKNKDIDRMGLNDLTGMNLVPFLITAHFEKKYRKIIEDASTTASHPIVALYDTQAILVEGDSYKLVGTGRKEFFNGFVEKS